MKNENNYGFKELLPVDYTDGYDVQQALNSKKRKRDMDSGVVSEEDDENSLTDDQKAKLKSAMERNKKRMKSKK
ncbi:MAG: hypothetical protein RJA52_156 [Bacteroidota bacterium]|jgi:hypothetical protein